MNPSLVILALRLGHLLRRILDNERAAAELQRLDARELADLGITRAQIRPYVQGRLRPAEDPVPTPLRLGSPPRRLKPVLRVVEGGLSNLTARTRPRPAPVLRLAAVRA